MSASITQLVEAANKILRPWEFNDYCPNGLQIEGRQEISRLVSGVTACQDLLDKAVEEGADAILVHHGYFWKGEDPTLTGRRRQRTATLIKHDINLLAYHLPLDAHPEFGNNAQLAKRLGLETLGSLGGEDRSIVGNWGNFSAPLTGEELGSLLKQVLGREPLHIVGTNNQISRVAWCTGAAQGYIEQAIEQGVEAYITGEVSESTVHIAREAGIHFFAAGHHVTERYGVQALGTKLAQQLGIEHQFIDIDNPV